jgi:hypothetical protein
MITTLFVITLILVFVAFFVLYVIMHNNGGAHVVVVREEDDTISHNARDFNGGIEEEFSSPHNNTDPGF